MYVLRDKPDWACCARVSLPLDTHIPVVSALACKGACACSAMSLGCSKSDPTSAYVAREVGLSVRDAELCVYLVHLSLLVGHTVMLCLALGIYPIIIVSAWFKGFLRLCMDVGFRYSRGDDPGMCDPDSCAGVYHYRIWFAVGACLYCCLMLAM